MSYVSHQSIGYSRILESRILRNIFFCLLFTEKVDFLLVNKAKKISVKTGFEELKQSRVLGIDKFV